MIIPRFYIPYMGVLVFLLRNDIVFICYLVSLLTRQLDR